MTRPSTMYVIGVDPGGTTGVVAMRFIRDEKPAMLDARQIEDWAEAAAHIERSAHHAMKMVRNYGGGALLAVERFVVNPQTARSGQQAIEDAMHMIGICRRAHHNFEIPWTLEPASAPKTMVPDASLRQLKIYTVGQRHVNDATRHAVFQGVKQGCVNPKDLLIG